MILGSSSKRRKEILEFFQIPFHVVTPNYNELALPYESDPTDYVEKISQGKSKAILDLNLGLPVLTADTIVCYQNQLFLKPKNQAEAIAMLSTLSGKTHEVLTAVTVADDQSSSTITVKSFVTFFPVDLDFIHSYVESIPVLDKAGGYAIQGAGSLIVEKIAGCFYNVMGLPISATAQLLNRYGINIWEFLKSSS